MSRSFQGKIEHADEPLYLPLLASSGQANFDAKCAIVALQIGDQSNDVLLDVLNATSDLS